MVSVSPATSRAVILLASGRARAASRMPSVIAGAGAKRLPVPAALRGLDLAPRHLALLANLQYDGEQRATVVGTMRAYEAALVKHAST